MKFLLIMVLVLPGGEPTVSIIEGIPDAVECSNRGFMQKMVIPEGYNFTFVCHRTR